MKKTIKEPKVITLEDKKKKALDSYTMIPKHNSFG